METIYTALFIFTAMFVVYAFSGRVSSASEYLDMTIDGIHRFILDNFLVIMVIGIAWVAYMAINHLINYKQSSNQRNKK